MIFYFSGTGNSLWIAKQLGEVFKEKLISVDKELNSPLDSIYYEIHPEEKIFFIFPVHSWGPAILISRFIKKIHFNNYMQQPVYAVCSCGDECGYTNKMMDQLLKDRGIILTDCFSITMPNNYILMKGFGIDSPDVTRQKLYSAPLQLEKIIESIRNGKKEKDLYKKGRFAGIKSRIIYPLFSKYAIRKNSFYVTQDCIQCGLCVQICPTKTISMEKDSRPLWNNNCIQCTACIHRCPTKAIQYGKITLNQGRYSHPELK